MSFKVGGGPNPFGAVRPNSVGNVNSANNAGSAGNAGEANPVAGGFGLDGNGVRTFGEAPIPGVYNLFGGASPAESFAQIPLENAVSYDILAIARA